MPIYEFHCDQCERDSEILVRSSRWKGSKCPHCGSTKLAKKLSVFASSGGGRPAAAAAGCQSGAGSCGCCCGGGKHRH
jgi:putative FmdB family regulatory protein